MEWNFKSTILEGAFQFEHGFRRDAIVHYLQTALINSPLVLEIVSNVDQKTFYIPCYANCGWAFVSEIIKQGNMKDSLEAAKVTAFFLYYHEAQGNVQDQPHAKGKG